MVSVNIKNFLIITLLSILGIVLFKVVFTKFQVKGVSDLVNAA